MMTLVFGRKIKPKKPLGEEVYQAIKEAILSGRLLPGQRLIEEELASSLGASRTPVRQAMYMLEREDLVGRLDRGGFSVQPVSDDDIAEILDLRCLLESFAARRAAENISDEGLQLLTRLNEAFGRSIGGGDPHRLATLNTEFHEALYRVSGRRRLQRIIHDLNDHLLRYRLALLKLSDMAQTSYQDHKEMIAAMTSHDPDLTERLVRTHILKGKAVIMDEVLSGRQKIDAETVRTRNFEPSSILER